MDAWNVSVAWFLGMRGAGALTARKKALRHATSEKSTGAAQKAVHAPEIPQGIAHQTRAETSMSSGARQALYLRCGTRRK